MILIIIQHYYITDCSQHESLLSPSVFLMIKPLDKKNFSEIVKGTNTSKFWSSDFPLGEQNVIRNSSSFIGYY